MEHREARNAALKEKIAELQKTLLNVHEKGLEIILPIMGGLYMPYSTKWDHLRWSHIYDAKNQLAELRKLAESLDQENSSSKSILALLHPLSTGLLMEMFGVGADYYAQNRFAMVRTCRSCSATALNMASVWSQFTICSWTSRGDYEICGGEDEGCPST
jgi:hypothetical protein